MSDSTINHGLTLEFENRGKIYRPNILEGVQWETEISGSPGKLTCEIMTDHVIDPGNVIRLYDDVFSYFYGYVFTTEHDPNAHKVKITAYDQIRYLKNQDTYVFPDATLSAIISNITSDYGIKEGVLANPSYKVKAHVAENKSLLDIIDDAIDEVMMYTGELYILFDYYGSLTLVNSTSSLFDTGMLIDVKSLQDYDIQSTIDDDDVYNRVRLVYKDSDAGTLRIFESPKDGKPNIQQEQWGLLQHYESLDDVTNAQKKADLLLSTHNHIKRTIRLKDVPGDAKTVVRAGSRIYVKMNLGDVQQDGMLIVNRCVHKWDNCVHLMDLDMEGGVFDA